MLGALAAFAFIGAASAAEPDQQAAQRTNEPASAAVPADPQSSDLFSKFRFYGEFGPIYLRRQGNEAFTFAGFLTPSLDLGWKTGLEARAGLTLGQFGAEFRWFDVGNVLNGWSEDAILRKGWLTVSSTTAIITEQSLAVLGTRLHSDFSNIEGNLRWQFHPYVAALAGVRFISLDDELRMSFFFAHDTMQGPITATSANIGTTTRNRLWGGQLGVDARVPLLGPKLLVGGTAKFAYLHDSVEHKLNLAQQSGSAIRADGSDGQNSWAIELGMDLRYKVLPWVSFVGGYQALWIQRIVQAQNQVSKLNLNMNTGVLSAPAGLGSTRGDSLWFHGPRAAIVFQLPN